MESHVSRARWAAVGAALAVTFGAGGLGVARATISSGPKPVFVAITPCRLVDTRPSPATVGGRATPLGAGEVATFTVRGSNGNCTIPSGAVSIASNVTMTEPTSDSFMTVFPADAEMPNSSSLNWQAGQAPTPNQVTVDLSAGGAIKVFNERGTVNVIVDIVGYFEDHRHDDRYYTEPEVDAAVAAAQPEIVTVGGAPAGFVFPAAQLTHGASTFTTTTTGFLHARLATSGGLNCATTSTYFGWLEVDGIPIRSSRVQIGVNFDPPDLTARHLSQKILEGVTGEPVAAGSHQLRAAFACISGNASSFASVPNAAGVVTVLTSTPTLPATATAALDTDSVDSDAPMTCTVDAAGSEVCSER